MIGHFHDSILYIQNVDGSVKYDIEFKKPIHILTVRLSPDKKKAAVIGSDDFTFNNGITTFNSPAQLWIVDLNTKIKSVVASKAADDVFWTDNGNMVFYSTGKETVSHDFSTGIKTTHHRFSRTDQGSNALSLSPDGNKVSYVYWKKDSRYIGVYDLQNASGGTLSKTCFSYTWIDNQTILHDTPSSCLKTLNLNNITSRQFLANLSSLKPQFEALNNSREWLNILSSTLDVYEEIHLPRYCRERVYFVGQAFTLKGSSITGLFSVKRDRTDLQVHFQHQSCSITRFDFLNNGSVIALWLSKHSKQNKLEHEWIYIGVDSACIPKGYVPITSDKSPVFAPISYT